uniref:AP2/ERF domain-containing protein n=1 Tax=Opuntia streptacantha TaxID=393608 RepID=A0A7C9E6Z7_OPUST
MVKSEHKIQSKASKPMPSPSPSSPPRQSSSSQLKKKYKGVRMRSWGSWVSEIRAPNQKTRIWLGSYSTPEAAARAYDAALLCLKGPSANLNFPMNLNSSYHIPDHNTVMSPKSIQRVAAAAANGFVDHNASTPPPSSSLASWSSSSSCSIASSPSSMSSSPPDQQLMMDDIFSLNTPGLESMFDAACGFNANANADSSSMLVVNESWLDLSPKYIDPMMSSIFFDPSSMNIEEFYEDGDIPLWSFC